MSVPPDGSPPDSSSEEGEGISEESDRIPGVPGQTTMEVGNAFAGGQRPPPPGMAFAGRRIASTLFGGGPVKVDRFEVLERLGAGGMGVVFVARDPRLDRLVALKLIEVTARTRLTAEDEAKALARLDHPNVVPVFETGTDGDHVYIAMQLLKGATLGQWSKGRPRAEIIEAYRQAGEGLLGAHRKGLVHRDFKPSNAIVAEDGDVRVIDFGLAVDPGASQGRPAVVGGTPGFMAPEQAAGEPATHLADQYSFAVSLENALKEHAAEAATALPKWLAATLTRGQASDPGQRFATMSDLLDGLQRPKLRPRTVGLSVAAVLLLAVGGVLGVRKLTEENCERVGDRLATAWPDRESAMAGLARMGAYGRELAQLLGPQLNRHAQGWTNQGRDICLKRREGVEPVDRLDWRRACQDQQLASLTAIRDVVRGATTERLPDVALAVQSLPDASLCREPPALPVKPPSSDIAEEVAQARNSLARTRVVLAAGDVNESYDAAGKIVTQARNLNYTPLLAEALLVAGQAASRVQDRREHAVPLLTEASKVGIQAGQLSVGVEAWARRAWVHGNRSLYAEALDGMESIEALAGRDEIEHFVRALFQNNVGSVLRERGQRGDRGTALAHFEAALKLSKDATGLGAVELVNVKLNVGITLEQREAQDEFLRQAEMELQGLVGSEHPETLDARWYRGRAMVSTKESRAYLRNTCDLYARHAAVRFRQRSCWAEVAFLSAELDDLQAARAEIERAERSMKGETDHAPEIPGYSWLWHGDPDKAAVGFRAAIAANESAFQGKNARQWHLRYRWANLQLGLGRALRSGGHLPEAAAAFDESIGVLTDIAAQQTTAAIDRRLARAQVERAAVAPVSASRR